MDHLRIVWQTAETLIESVRFREDPENTKYNVLISLQEMLTNIIRHAYESKDRPIDVEFSVSESTFEAVLKDQGPEFDPTAFEPDADASAAEEGEALRVGGYGIVIARMVMDAISYQRDGDWNVLRLTKSVPEQPATVD